MMKMDVKLLNIFINNMNFSLLVDSQIYITKKPGLEIPLACLLGFGLVNYRYKKTIGGTHIIKRGLFLNDLFHFCN